MLRKFVSPVPNVTLKNNQITDDARTPCSHAEARTVKEARKRANASWEEIAVH